MKRTIWLFRNISMMAVFAAVLYWALPVLFVAILVGGIFVYLLAFRGVW